MAKTAPRSIHDNRRARVRGSLVGRFLTIGARLLDALGKAAEDFEDHPEFALGV